MPKRTQHSPLFLREPRTVELNCNANFPLSFKTIRYQRRRKGDKLKKNTISFSLSLSLSLHSCLIQWVDALKNFDLSNWFRTCYLLLPGRKNQVY